MSGSVGDNVFRASGVIAAAAGRTGAVSWDTTPKTGTVTAEDGVGYFVNTAAAVRTVNLPAGSAGAIVAVADYTRTFNTNNCTVAPDGSEKIGGVAEDATLSVNGQSATFVYVDGTEGWVNVQETQTSQTGVVPFIVATGGCITTSGDYKIHTFLGDGTFCVSAVGSGSPTQSDEVSYVVVAGGGSGAGADGSGGTPGSDAAGGGGAGGFREGKNSSDPYTDSPLDTGSGLTVSVQGYPIDIGAGGPTPTDPAPTGVVGENSTFSSITSAGGGFGGDGPSTTPQLGGDGGSGGGAGGGSAAGKAGGSGDTPPTPVAQGQDGGTGGSPPPGTDKNSGGGGGATVAGGNASTPTSGAGGTGATSSINATPTAYAGGGGGGGSPPTPGVSGCGGAGGGGAGGVGGPEAAGVAGGTNTGGGGGGGGNTGVGGAGGSGIVIIRYKYQ